MQCSLCGSDNLTKFNGTIALHFRGRENLTKPHVYVSPEVAVCLDCGNAKFVVPKHELGQLSKGKTSADGGV